MMLTLTLAVGLLAAHEPQAEPPKGWVVELHGYTYHRQAKPEGEGWIIEVRASPSTGSRQSRRTA
jgi:hypothetical protein